MNGVTTKYTLEGSLVKFEKTGSTNIWYYYDASGSPVGMCIGGSSLYLYRKNLQGDITGIYSGSTGALLVSYIYDAWGKPTILNVAGTTESTNLIARNPYLYRGYRYDQEIGLYYLNSRYYDPETGRFVNADVLINTGKHIFGTNTFAYCYDNPNNYVDKNGADAILLLDDTFLGHLGALIQDAEGTWWHFYWGANGFWRTIESANPFAYVEAYSFCQKYDGEISIEGINKSKQYAYKYDRMVRIVGDFSKAVDFAKDWVENTKQLYNLYFDNCTKVTLGVLGEADTVYKKDLLKAASEHILPYTAFKEIYQKISSQYFRYIPSGIRDRLQ